jgi:hypothetical protein
MRAFEFDLDYLLEALDPEKIKSIKAAYDQGKTYVEIGRMHDGMTKKQVGKILTRHYPDRPTRRPDLEELLTDDDKKDMASAFTNGTDMRSIANDIGMPLTLVKRVLIDVLGNDVVTKELDRRRTQPKLPVSGKVTPEVLAKIRSSYASGKTIFQISDELGNLINASKVYKHLSSQEDWLDLRAKWRESRMVKHDPQASTMVNKPGTVGNKQHKGPKSKHQARKLD